MSFFPPKWCHALLAVGLGFVALTPRPARAAAERPHIVFILADDLGAGDCGFSGGTQIKTPHLDRLANGGVRLSQFYVQPVCSPTRAALLTGRYPIRHGLQVGVVRPWAQYGLPLKERTLAAALKEAGYTTALVGKWHLGHFRAEYLPTRRGFDHQYGHYNGALDYFTHERDGGFDWHRDDKICREEGYSTHLLAREAVRLIRAQPEGQPLFLYLAFNAVHAPYQVPDEYRRPYAELPEPRRTYAGMVAAMDEAVGQVVAAVEEKGLTRRTLFIFSSDNGGPRPGQVTSNGTLRAGKSTLYEGGVRVPAFATWAGHLQAGLTVAEPLHIVDWYPTLLRLAGAPRQLKPALDGRDLWPVLTENARTPHETILLNAAPHRGALRAGDWKLVWNGAANDAEFEESKPRAAARRRASSRAGGFELYNVAKDPGEKENVASEHPEVEKRLRGFYDQLARQAVAPKVTPRPAGFKSPAVWGE